MNKPSIRQKLYKGAPFKIAAVYAIAGGLWIILSDNLLAALVKDPATLTQLQTFKGWFFIIVTALMLYLLINRYLSEVRHHEEALRESEEHYRTLIETAFDGIHILDLEGNFIFVNKQYCRMLGYSKEELMVKNFSDTLLPDKKEEGIGLFKEIIRENLRFSMYEGKNLRRDGGLIDVQIKWSFIYKDGTVNSVVGIVRDISERKQVEEKIRKLYSLQIVVRNINQVLLRVKNRPELFQKVCDLLTDVEHIKFVWIGLVDEGSYEVKPVAQSGFEEGYLFSIKVTWDDSEYGRGPTGTAIKTGKPFIMRDIENDPRFSPWREDAMKRGYASSIALPLVYKRGMIGALNVYSEKKDAFGDEETAFLLEVAEDIAIGIKSIKIEESLIESERRYRHLVESVTDYIYTVEIENGKPVSTKHGPGCVAVTGYTSEELEADSHLWYRMIYEEDRRTVIEQAEKILSGETVAPIEHRIIHKDGSIRWVRNTSVPRYDEQGRLIAFDGLIKDITEQKNLEEQLRHSQKMEAVGQLAGGVAHDFNNIITAIIGYGNLLKIKIKEDDSLKHTVEQILASAERAATLTQGLLAFSRKQIINTRPVNPNNIIKRIEGLILRLVGENIELKTILTGEDITVMADSGQIEQALMNLCTNARDAMPDRGILTISTELVKLDNEFINKYGYGKPGMYSLISVTDTGKGMDENSRKKIFEPFFTTKEAGKGTGLGLSITYGIIKQHNGYITCYSESGKGTTFGIYLPLSKVKAEEESPTEPLDQISGTETILLAEDEADIRGPLKDVLERFGYKVIDAVDGEDAINKFIDNKDKIEFLIFNVMMPKKTGKEAYLEIRKIKPDIKALFMSGYPADVVHKEGILEEGLNFISKPVSPKALLRKVREVLDKK